MQNKKTVVIVTGKAQSGKDTSCDYMINKLRYQLSFYPCSPREGEIKYRKFHFAFSLKEFCVDVLGVEYHKIYGTNEQKDEFTHIKWTDLPFASFMTSGYQGSMKAFGNEYLTGRQLLQIFGTNICRRMYNDCWAINTIKRIARGTQKIAFISDARFPNELDIFLNSEDIDKVIVINLARNPLNYTHLSETALDEYDYSGFDNFYYINNKQMTEDERNERIEKIMIEEKLLNNEAVTK